MEDLTNGEIFERLEKEHQDRLGEMFGESGIETWEGFMEGCLSDYVKNPDNRICKGCLATIYGFDVNGECEDCINGDENN